MIAETIAKGIEAQLKAETRANELGFIVSKPTTDCCRYDMIIDNGSCLKRIQVKYCNHECLSSSGSVQVNLRKYSINGKERPFYSSDEVDAVIIYIKPIDKLCYFDIKEIGNRKSITIRYLPSKNNQAKNIFDCNKYLW